MVEAFADFATPQWISRVIDLAGEELRPLVSELAMIDIPVRRVTIPAPRLETPEGAASRAAEEQRRTEAGIQSYVVDVCVALLESDLIRQRGELQSILQRTPDDATEQHELQQRISELELRRRALRVE
jgi:ATP/maltotriose-dependent transcriptional regulator MalT